MSKKGLGKGLSALIPEVTVTDRDLVRDVELSRIRPNPRQPRKHFDLEKLEELAQSIRENGLVQPLIVRPQGDAYEIVAGERRWRAAQMAGHQRLPVVIREITDAKMMEIALIENLQRQDLNPLEEAEAFHTLLEEYHLTQDELARRLGKSRPQITNTLRLLSLAPELQREVAAGRLSVGHAKVLLGVEDGPIQQHWAGRVAREGLTVRQLEDALQQEATARPDKPQRYKRVLEPDTLSLEDRLRQLLGTPVKIHPGSSRGQIVISFFGDEDLTRISDIILDRAHPEPAPPKRNFHI